MVGYERGGADEGGAEGLKQKKNYKKKKNKKNKKTTRGGATHERKVKLMVQKRLKDAEH